MPPNLGLKDVRVLSERLLCHLEDMETNMYVWCHMHRIKRDRAALTNNRLVFPAFPFIFALMPLTFSQEPLNWLSAHLHQSWTQNTSSRKMPPHDILSKKSPHKVERQTSSKMIFSHRSNFFSRFSLSDVSRWGGNCPDTLILAFHSSRVIWTMCAGCPGSLPLLILRLCLIFLSVPPLGPLLISVTTFGPSCFWNSAWNNLIICDLWISRVQL